MFTKTRILFVAFAGFFLLVTALPYAVLASTPLIKIYFTDAGADIFGGGAGTVRSVNPDGTGLATLVAAAGIRPRGIAIDKINGHLYWNDFGDPANPGTTQRCNLDGTNVVTIVNHGTAGVNDIALDIAAGKIYMALSVSYGTFHGVRRVNFDGTGLVDLITTWPAGFESPPGTFTGWFIDGIDVDAATGHIYYGDIGILIPDGDPSGIVRTALDGTGNVSLVPHLAGRGRGMAVDAAGGKVYFAQHDPSSAGSGTIWRVNLDGTGLQAIVVGLARPRDVALDLFGGRVYWVDEATFKIQSSKLDGTDVQDVIGGLDGPSSLALQCDITVPVALQSFDSYWTGSHVEVAWRLINISGELAFEVSRMEGSRGSLAIVQNAGVIRRGGEFIFQDHDTQPGTTYRYRVVVFEDGEAVTSFETRATTPSATFALDQNQPNPFNPTTRIDFMVDRDGHVVLAVYDIAGRLVATLVDRRMGAGRYSEEWNGLDSQGAPVATGVYFYRLTAGSRTLTRKAVLVK